MSAKGYYVYFDGEGRAYFLEAESQISTYKKPTDGTIYDPETLEVWDGKYPDGTIHADNEVQSDLDESSSYDADPEENEGEKTDEATDKGLNAVTPSSSIAVSEGFDIDIPEEVATFQPNVNTPKQEKSPIVPAADGADDEISHFLPGDVMEKIHQFQIKDFARQYFREHRSTHVFNRKRIAIDALISFSPEPLAEPLLLALDKNCTKLALQCFKWILAYTKVIPTRSPDFAAEQIVNTLYANPSLRDEVYFQLIKQTSHTPTNQILNRGMELFLIMATIFPSSRNSENWIKAHLVNMSRHPDILVSAIAQFTFIRFTARCAVGKPRENNEVGYIKSIPMQVAKSWHTFGSSIYEMMWNQRQSMPKLPIPFIEYRMTEDLIKKGAEHSEGIFRLPGNLRKVDDLVTAFNNGKDQMDDSPLNDTASLFKRWFRDLPNPVVPIDRVSELVNVFDDGTKAYIDFCETKMPRPHRAVLKFLIGFLQHLTKFEPETKMTAKNFAIVFGPNIVQSNDVTEQSMVKKFSDVAIDFMMTLIDTWDTSDIYPMPRELLDAAQ